MNWQQVKGNWKQVKGHARNAWGNLTDDDLNEIDGDREIMIGRIQEKYGVAREAVAEKVDEWFDLLAERPE